MTPLPYTTPAHVPERGTSRPFFRLSLSTVASIQFWWEMRVCLFVHRRRDENRNTNLNSLESLLGLVEIQVRLRCFGWPMFLLYPMPEIPRAKADTLRIGKSSGLVRHSQGHFPLDHGAIYGVYDVLVLFVEELSLAHQPIGLFHSFSRSEGAMNIGDPK